MRLFTTVLLGWLLLWNSAQAAQPFQPKLNVGGQSLRSHVEYILDPGHAFTWNDLRTPKVAARFRSIPKHVPHPSDFETLKPHTLWLRFKLTLDPKTPLHSSWLLSFGAILDQPPQLFVVPEKRDGTPLSGYYGSVLGSDLTKPATFPLLRSDNIHRYTVCAKVTGTFSPQRVFLSLFLWEVSAYQRDAYGLILLIAFYFGIMVLVVAISLAVFFFFRDPTYLLYVLFQSSVMTYLFLKGPLGHSMLREKWFAPSIYPHVVELSLASLIVWNCLFSRVFLRTRERSLLYDRAFLVFLAVGLVYAATIVLGFHYDLATYIGLSVPFFITFVGLSAWLRGDRSALYYFLGQFAFFFSAFIMVLEFQGVVTGPSLGLLWMYLGSILEAILLLIALLDRLYRVRKEHAMALQRMAQADRMASLGQLMGGIAHELNNPNNFISFNLPLVEKALQSLEPALEEYSEDNPDWRVSRSTYEDFLEETYKLIENMKYGSNRISSLVSELKSFVRNDEQELRQLEPLKPVVERVLTLVGHSLRKEVHLEVEVSPNLPNVQMNSGKIEQVLMNLLLNASQAAKERDDALVALRVRQDGEEVRLEVQDNGVGIAPELLDKIFEPFFTTKSREEGTGLGLAIAKEIVMSHGGDILVESSLGTGSRFTVLLPLGPSE